MKKLYLISNDKIWFTKKNYTSNNDLNNILSCLNKNFDVQLICRKSTKKFEYEISEKIKFSKISNINDQEINILMISISPFNFFSLLKMIFLRKRIKGYVYLRSDGFLEYKFRYGKLGYFIYFLMFNIIKKKLKILSCSNNFTKVKVKKILHPSELDWRWFKKRKIIKKFKTDFLYIGRFTKDKGSIFLTNIFKKNLKKYKLTFVGTKKKFVEKNYYSKNIKFKGPVSSIQKLINLYDSSKIFILPSYIEGFPKVISESLSRLRPVIIFEDIQYVVYGRKGIFVCKRNERSLKKTINYVLKNYRAIQKDIKKNYFYTKNNFMRELLNSIKI